MQEKARLQTQPGIKKSRLCNVMKIHRPAQSLSLNLKLEAWSSSFCSPVSATSVPLLLLNALFTMIKFSQTAYLKVVLTKHETDLARCERVKRQFGWSRPSPRRWFVFAYFFMAFLTNFCFNYHYATRCTVAPVKAWVLSEFISVHLITFVS